LVVVTSDHGHTLDSTRAHSDSTFPVPLTVLGNGVPADTSLSDMRNNDVATILAEAYGIGREWRDLKRL
jgi:hypothetical protein